MSKINREEMTTIYDEMVARIPEAVRKGKKTPYTSMNGNMYSFVTQEGEIALRFGKEDLEKFIEDWDAKPCIQYGAVMRGYAEMPDAVYSNSSKLDEYFQRCYENAKTLKPKPSKKPR